MPNLVYVCILVLILNIDKIFGLLRINIFISFLSELSVMYHLLHELYMIAASCDYITILI